MLSEPMTRPDDATLAEGHTPVAEPGTVGADAADSEGQPRPSRGGFFAPLRLASFRRLIGGQTISRLGDQFYFLAIPWLVLRITPSPARLALVLGVAALTLGLFTLVGG